MESAHQSNLAMSLNGEMDGLNREYAQAQRDSQQGDPMAGARLTDLKAHIASIKEDIKTADQASKTAEAKENDEKVKKEEEEFKRHLEEKLAQESNNKDSGYKFLDDVDKSTKQQALAASAQPQNSVTAQVAGKAKTTLLDEDNHETKAVSSGQAST